MARQSKSLAAHVRDGTFRPSAHLHLLVSGADLPVKTPDPNPTPAMTRLTARLRELQVEARDVRSAEVRYDLAREFGRVAGDYVKARDHAPPDDEDVVAGLRELRAALRIGEDAGRAQRGEPARPWTPDWMTRSGCPCRRAMTVTWQRRCSQGRMPTPYARR